MDGDEGYVAEVKVSIDCEKSAVRKLPFNIHDRALEIYFNLELPKGDHTLDLIWLNPVDELNITVSKYVVYSDEPINK